MEFTDTKIITGLVAAGAAIVGSAIGAYSKTISSRQKINELREIYSNKLQDNYLENAREYTESVYAPLSIALSKLIYEFRNYRARENIEDISKREFIEAIQDFIDSVSMLMAMGAGAFLTAELDEKLQSFCSFLEESKYAESPVSKMIITFSLPFFGASFKDKSERNMSGKLSRVLLNSRVSASLGGLGFSYEAKEILAAPISSRHFEERFVRDSHLVNVLIKEVTLGAKAKHSLDVAR